jgi:phage tail-like protein
VYLDGDFGMRFVGGMEVVLDPIVATIESLPALFDAELAPEHLLTLLSSWLGLSTDEQLGPGVRRELVRNAAELTRLRGTAAGLQLLLHITFPEAGLVVEDGGGVQVDEGVPTPPAATSRSFKVRSRTALDDERRAAVIRAIERERPVHVSYELVEPTRRPAARAGGPR